MPLITINETVNKCGHILVEIDNRKFTLTKAAVKGADIITVGNLEDNIIINKMRNDIKDSNETDWGKIKTTIEAKEYKT